MKYEITKEEYDKAYVWAEKMTEKKKKYYASRNQQCDETKIHLDFLTGILGEVVASKDLGTVVNYEILPAHLCSYKADMSKDGHDIHVKSQNWTSVSRFGKAWCVSIWDSIYTNPTYIDWFCLTTISEGWSSGEIVGYINAPKVVYSDPDLKYLKNKKVIRFSENEKNIKIRQK